MDPDLNKYDIEHAVSDHPLMSRAELQEAYFDAWRRYYSREHVETLIHRAAASGTSLRSFVVAIVPFIHMVSAEGVHPLQAGLFRRKHRAERRHGLSPEPAWKFYFDHIRNSVVNNLKLAATGLWILRLKRTIKRNPNRLAYTDIAMTPVSDRDEDMLDLLNKTAGARSPIEHIWKVERLTR